MKIYTVDAFVDPNKSFSGNPAAVMPVDDFPSDEMCQNIAKEMNLSETAFVKQLTLDHFHIRWFTPAVEVKLCGHATLATAHILYEEGLTHAARISFESKSGLLTVVKNQNEFTLDFPLQPTGQVLDKITFEKILNTEIITATQALDDVLIELPSEMYLRNFKPNFEKIVNIDCRGLILTARADEDSQYDFVSRFFGPRVGVPEDPVTGSAHCKLADYWHKKLGKTEFVAYQASPRGGEIKLAVEQNRVKLKGRALTVIQGKWLNDARL